MQVAAGSTYTPPQPDAGPTVYNLTAWDHAQLLQAALSCHGEHDPFISTLADVVELSEKCSRLVSVMPDTMGGVPPESSYYKAWKAVVKPPRIIPAAPAAKQAPKSQTSGGLSARAMNQLALPQEAVRFRTALISFLDRPVEEAIQLARTAPLLDLRRLFIEVTSKGGSTAVTQSESWPDIAAELVHDSKLVNELQQVYNFYLLPLELSMPWGTRAGRIIEYIESKVRERAEVGAAGRTAQRLCESARKLLKQAYGIKSEPEGDHKAAGGDALPVKKESAARTSGEDGAHSQDADADAPHATSSQPEAPVEGGPDGGDSQADDSSLGAVKASKVAARLLRLYAANPLLEMRHESLLPGVRSVAAQQLLEEEEAKLTQQHLTKQKRGVEEKDNSQKEKEAQLRGTKRSRVRHHHQRADDEMGEDGGLTSSTMANGQAGAVPSSAADANTSQQTSDAQDPAQPTSGHSMDLDQSAGRLNLEAEDIRLLAASHTLVLASLALRSGPPGCGLRRPPILRRKVAVPKKEEEPPEVEPSQPQDDQPPSPSAADQRKKSPWTVTPKCGDCKTCRNPKLKKACITNRERLAQGLEPVFIQEPLKLKDVLGA